MKTEFHHKGVYLSVENTSDCRLQVYQKYSPKSEKGIYVQITRGHSVAPLVIASVYIPAQTLTRNEFLSWGLCQGFEDCQIIGDKYSRMIG